ncbi:SDR family NAD(P)-dependent oxidoreductase [Ekhidna sp.]|uniref:SDR family NAD(P)-dependent oxidoreductase n=1 Tax=Ekhidna sp. TaxID=2608089 RepID=UPI003C7D72DB
MMDFKSKYGPWAIVTGASSGIGKEMAIQLSNKGVNLVLITRNLQNLNTLHKELNKEVSVKSLELDLKDADFLDKLEVKLNGLNIGLLVHAAGAMYVDRYMNTSVQDEVEMINLNVVASVKLTRHFSGRFAKRGRGGIILFGSMLGFIGTPLMTAYSATKAYQNTYAEALHHELKQYNIDVLSVVPGLTDTPMTSMYDFSSLPMKMSSAKRVAADAIKSLGKKSSTTYGFMNKIMNWSSKHVMSRKLNTNLFGYLLKKVNKKQ